MVKNSYSNRIITNEEVLRRIQKKIANLNKLNIIRSRILRHDGLLTLNIDSYVDGKTKNSPLENQCSSHNTSSEKTENKKLPRWERKRSGLDRKS